MKNIILLCCCVLSCITAFGQTRKYGTFTKDGTTYIMDDDMLRQMAAYSPTFAEEIRRGKNITYESRANNGNGAISCGYISSLTTEENNQLSKSARAFESARVKAVRKEITALKNFYPRQNYSPAPPKTRILLTEDLYLDYITNSDGSKIKFIGRKSSY